MLKIKIAENPIHIKEKEVLRYLGYRNATLTENEKEIIEKITAEVQNALNCKICYDRFPISFEKDGYIDLGFAKVKSEKLSINLKNCDEIFLFTATIGTAVDRIIQKYSLTSPLKGVIAQAAGTAAIEEWCDVFVGDLKKEDFLRPRFSPGYGDLTLDLQKEIFNALDCERKIGVILTDDCLMLPTKSVSAIAGISKNDDLCVLSGCENCDKKCEYRRN